MPVLLQSLFAPAGQRVGKKVLQLVRNMLAEDTLARLEPSASRAPEALGIVDVLWEQLLQRADDSVPESLVWAVLSFFGDGGIPSALHRVADPAAVLPQCLQLLQRHLPRIAARGNTANALQQLGDARVLHGLAALAASRLAPVHDHVWLLLLMAWQQGDGAMRNAVTSGLQQCPDVASTCVALCERLFARCLDTVSNSDFELLLWAANGARSGGAEHVARVLELFRQHQARFSPAQLRQLAAKSSALFGKSFGSWHAGSKPAAEPARPKPAAEPARPTPAAEPARPKPAAEPARPKPAAEPARPKPAAEPARPQAAAEPKAKTDKPAPSRPPASRSASSASADGKQRRQDDSDDDSDHSDHNDDEPAHVARAAKAQQQHLATLEKRYRAIAAAKRSLRGQIQGYVDDWHRRHKHVPTKADLLDHGDPAVCCFAN